MKAILKGLFVVALIWVAYCVVSSESGTNSSVAAVQQTQEQPNSAATREVEKRPAEVTAAEAARAQREKQYPEEAYVCAYVKAVRMMNGKSTDSLLVDGIQQYETSDALGRPSALSREGFIAYQFFASNPEYYIQAVQESDYSAQTEFPPATEIWPGKAAMPEITPEHLVDLVNADRGDVLPLRTWQEAYVLSNRNMGVSDSELFQMATDDAKLTRNLNPEWIHKLVEVHPGSRADRAFNYLVRLNGEHREQAGERKTRP
jgi:hypothetical protein